MKKIPYQIIYEDDKIIIIYKNRDFLSIRTDDIKTRFNNIYFFLSCYLNKKKEKCYLVHRLDFETSGLMIFAKGKEICSTLVNQFENRMVRRYYEAVIKEKIDLNKEFEVVDKIDDKEAITYIKSINYINIGTALDIEIKTGRHNQIRKAISSLGYTLLGDKRYSKDVNKRMYLNAYKLEFEKNEYLNKNLFEVKPLWIKKGEN